MHCSVYNSLAHLQWAIETGMLMLLVMFAVMLVVCIINRTATIDPSNSPKARADEALTNLRARMAIVRRARAVQQQDMLRTMAAAEYGYDPEVLRIADPATVDRAA